MHLAPPRQLARAASISRSICAGAGVLAQPGGKVVFGQLARGDGEHGEHAVGIGGGELVAIQVQKQLGGHKADALVAVDEGGRETPQP